MSIRSGTARAGVRTSVHRRRLGRTTMAATLAVSAAVTLTVGASPAHAADVVYRHHYHQVVHTAPSTVVNNSAYNDISVMVDYDVTQYGGSSPSCFEIQTWNIDARRGTRAARAVPSAAATVTRLSDIGDTEPRFADVAARPFNDSTGQAQFPMHYSGRCVDHTAVPSTDQRRNLGAVKDTLRYLLAASVGLAASFVVEAGLLYIGYQFFPVFAATGAYSAAIGCLAAAAGTAVYKLVVGSSWDRSSALAIIGSCLAGGVTNYLYGPRITALKNYLAKNATTNTVDVTRDYPPDGLTGRLASFELLLAEAAHMA